METNPKPGPTEHFKYWDKRKEGVLVHEVKRGILN